MGLDRAAIGHVVVLTRASPARTRNRKQKSLVLTRRSILLARRDVRMTGGAHGRYEAASEVRCVPLCSRLCVPAALRSTCSGVAPTARGARVAGRRSRMRASTYCSRCAASWRDLRLGRSRVAKCTYDVEYTKCSLRLREN